MRATWFILLVPVAAHAAGVEFEAGPGYAWSTDISGASAALLRARLGVDFGWFTPSIAGFGTLSDPGPLAHQRQGGGWRGWGIAGELRIHSEGEHRIFAALDLGLGQLSTLQAENGDTEGYQGKVAPYVGAALGYQWAAGQLRLAAALTLDLFTNVNLEGDLGTRFCVDNPPIGVGAMECPTGRAFPMLGLTLSLGFGPNGGR